MSPTNRSNLLSLITMVPLLTALSCATTTTTSATWSTPSPTGGARYGSVESIQEVVQRTQGNPAAGALTGALIGGFLFRGRGPASLIGAAGGAAVGAAASQGSAETHAYHLLVRFEDGAYGVFVYRQYSPFRPGDRVMLTSHGLTGA